MRSDLTERNCDLNACIIINAKLKRQSWEGFIEPKHRVTCGTAGSERITTSNAGSAEPLAVAKRMLASTHEQSEVGTRAGTRLHRECGSVDRIHDTLDANERRKN